MLEDTFETRNRPEPIRSDDGREFISTGRLEWLRSEGVEPIHIGKALVDRLPPYLLKVVQWRDRHANSRRTKPVMLW